MNILKQIGRILRTHGKESNSLVPKNFSLKCNLDNGVTITNPYDIANSCNNYFAAIIETTQKIIKYSHKHFSILS